MPKRDPNDMSDAEIVSLVRGHLPSSRSDPDAEISFIAAARADPCVLDDCRLEPSDFCQPQRRFMFVQMVRARRAGRQIEVTGVPCYYRAADPRSARVAIDRLKKASAARRTSR